ncbi:MAG: hypothetical protein HY292_07785 [Planctomycetes bacterium]|nr:hypothetical protein [Planctomycetota bacterium]
MSTTNGNGRNGGTRVREVTITITLDVTETRPGPPKGERGTYRAFVNGQEIATRAFNGGWRKKAAARTALFAMLDSVEELH